MIEYTLIDDFFIDADKVRKYALSLNYEKSTNETGWKGFRTPIVDIDLLHYIKDRLVKINDYFKELNLNIYFHYTIDSTKNDVVNFTETRLHKDATEWAGVVYLTPNPKPNSGTTIHNNKGEMVHNIENKYNRLIFYKGDILHGVLDTFGDNIENSRLTVTIFGNKLPKTGKTLI
jgi:hypothetical protein